MTTLVSGLSLRPTLMRKLAMAKDLSFCPRSMRLLLSASLLGYARGTGLEGKDNGTC